MKAVAAAVRVHKNKLKKKQFEKCKTGESRKGWATLAWKVHLHPSSHAASSEMNSGVSNVKVTYLDPKNRPSRAPKKVLAVHEDQKARRTKDDL